MVSVSVCPAGAPGLKRRRPWSKVGPACEMKWGRGDGRVLAIWSTPAKSEEGFTRKGCSGWILKVD